MHNPARPLAYWALFAGLTAICAWISVPLGNICFTMQTFALFLGLFTLGGRGGSMAFLVYLLMGLVGLPVFSGFRGGPGAFLGVTGGFLWGLALAGPIYWCLTRLWGEKMAIRSALIGTAVCYLCGWMWICVAYAPGTSWWAVALQWVVPYVLPDLGKIFLARWLSRRLRPYCKV